MPIRNLLPLAEVRERLEQHEAEDDRGPTYQRLQTMLRHHMSKRKGANERRARHQAKIESDPHLKRIYRIRRNYDQQQYLIRKEQKDAANA